MYTYIYFYEKYTFRKERKTNNKKLTYISVTPGDNQQFNSQFSDFNQCQLNRLHSVYCSSNERKYIIDCIYRNMYYVFINNLCSLKMIGIAKSSFIKKKQETPINKYLQKVGPQIRHHLTKFDNIWYIYIICIYFYFLVCIDK